jgi:hypothetical protein
MTPFSPRQLWHRARERHSSQRRQRARWLALAPTLVLAVGMSAWVAHETSDGLGHLAVDSATYISTADSLHHFHAPTVAFTSVWDGYSPAQAVKLNGRVPTTVFPPGYPAALALTSFAAGSVRGAARALDIVLIGVNLLLVGWLTARMTAFRSTIAASIPAIMLVFTSDIPRLTIDHWGWLVVHLSVASDPLFFALFLVALFALSRAVTQDRRSTVVVAGCVTAIAVLVRYVGVSLVLTGVIAFVVFDRRRASWARIQRAGAFAGIALAPMLLFFAWGAIHGAHASQGIAFHSVDGSLKLTLDEFGLYLFPGTWSYGLRTVGLVLVAVLVVIGALVRPSTVARYWSNGDEQRQLIQLALISIVAYVLVLIASRTFVDVRIPIDARLLAPVRGIWYATVVAVAYRTLVPFAHRRGAAAILSAVTGLTLIGGWAHQVTPLRQRLTPAQPQRTSVDDVIARLPVNALLLSSAPDAVYLRLGRPALALPSRSIFTTGEPNRAYKQQLLELARILNARGGYLDWRISFDPIATPAELRRFVTLRLISASRNTSVGEELYEIAPKEPAPG